MSAGYDLTMKCAYCKVALRPQRVKELRHYTFQRTCRKCKRVWILRMMPSLWICGQVLGEEFNPTHQTTIDIPDTK